MSTRNHNPFDLGYQVHLISDVFLQPLYLLVIVPMANNAYLPSCLSYCLIIALVILGGKNKNFIGMFNTKRKGSLRICSFPAHNCPVLYFLWLHEWTTVVASRLKNYWNVTFTWFLTISPACGCCTPGNSIVGNWCAFIVFGIFVCERKSTCISPCG